MNFLEKIFGKKERIEEQPIKIRLKFNEIDKWFDNETSEFLDSVNQTIKDSFKEIENISEQINNNLENLEKAESKKHHEDRLKRLALDNRIAFIKKIQTFNNKIKFPDSKDTFHVLKFYDNLGNEINRLARETAKNIHFTNMLFAEELKEITDTLRTLSYTAKESKKTLDKDKLELIFGVQEDIQETKNLINIQKTENERLKRNKLTLKELQNEEKKIHQTLDKLNESNELTHFKQTKEQLKILDDQLNKIQDDTLQMFSPLGKALKKYERHGTGFNKDEMKILTFYIKSPFKAVLLDKDFKTLDKILENTENLINSDKISLKNKQKQKTLININKLKKRSELNSILTEYKKIQELNENLTNKIRDIKINKKIDSAKQKLNNLENMIENKKQKIHKLENNLDNIDQNISHKINELEIALKKISNKDVLIKSDSVLKTRF